jgi:hypothetical protein
MQFLLTLEERKIVTPALEKYLVQVQADDARHRANRLLDRILEHDLHLSADELEDLSAFSPPASGRLKIVLPLTSIRMRSLSCRSNTKRLSTPPTKSAKPA